MKGQDSSFTLNIAGQELLCRLATRKSRAVSLRYLRDEGVLVIATPDGQLSAQAQAFIREKTSWILSRYQESQVYGSQRTRFEAELAAGRLLYLGEYVPLRVERSLQNRVRFVAGEVLLSLRNPEKELRGWLLGGLRSLAKDYLTRRTLELAVAHGCVIENVRIKELSSKWGSCSSKRNINLNWRLIFMPHSASDYIILHEFAHLKEMNHGPRFWKEVQRLCPGYEKEERMIKEYQWVLGLM